MQSVTDYTRVLYDGTPLFNAVTLASTRTAVVDMNGFNTLILYVNLSARTATTAVLFNFTSRHPNASTTDFKETCLSSISAAGVGTRVEYQDSYATTAAVAYKIVVPNVGGYVTVSLSGTAGGAGDVVTVHYAKAVS